MAKAIDEKKVLAADNAFQRQQAALNRALGEFQKGQTAEAGARKLDYEGANYALGYDPTTQSFDVNDKSRGYAQATNSARQNFAGRGMLRSSGYGQARANVGKQFEKQATDLRTGQQQFEQGQTTGLESFKADQADTLAAAREAALQRWRDAQRAGMF